MRYGLFKNKRIVFSVTSISAIVCVLICVCITGCQANQTPQSISFSRTTASEFSEEDGWLYVFRYERMKDPIQNQDPGLIHYTFLGMNLRYTYNGAPARERAIQQGGDTSLTKYYQGMREWGTESEAQKRDMAIIYDQILRQDATVEELLALKEEDFEFEELDEVMFFRLMRDALTSEPDPEPVDIKHMEIPSYAVLQEPVFIDGYAFQICLVSSMGYVDDIYIDLLYEDDSKECGYIQLSDLVESGEATSEQEKAFQEIKKTTEMVRGAEDIPKAIEGMNRETISDIDFDRLFAFLDHLGHYEYSQYVTSPKVIQ